MRSCSKKWIGGAPPSLGNEIRTGEGIRRPTARSTHQPRGSTSRVLSATRVSWSRVSPRGRFYKEAHMRRFFLYVSLMMGTAAGCGAGLEHLRARAAYDFNCPENQLSVAEVDSVTKSVSGCGKKGTFVERCTRLPFQGTECTWVLNSGAAQSPGEPATPQTSPAVSR